MKRICLRAAQVALLSWTALAGAEVVPNLYQADVPVAEQSPAELRRAARAGLAEVLVRVSGQTDAERNPALAAALAQAERYLEQYRYERNPAPGEQPWLARLNFAGDQSERLLRNAGLPVWGANRPSLLVVLAFDDGSGARSLVSESGQPELVAALQEQARRRGLSLHFPPADAAAQLPPDAIWQLDAGAAQPLLERYHADSLLLGHLTQTDGHWAGAWSLTLGEQRSDAEAQGDSLPASLTPAFNKLADALGAQYAVSAAGGAEGLLLRLNGIGNFDDYARALAYLQQLGAVKAVSPLQIRGDEVILRLRVEGGAEQLSRQLALDSRLQPQPLDNATFGNQAIALQYRWAPPAAG